MKDKKKYDHLNGYTKNIWKNSMFGYGKNF